MLKTIFVLMLVIAVGNAIVCTKDFCKDKDCMDISCSADEKRVEKGTFCGCCPACKKLLHKGESCFLSLVRGVPSPVICENGTKCDSKSMTCQ